MLEQVPAERVRLGMYITGVDCSWLRSPFWRTRFLLTDPADLAALHASGIAAVTIDPRRGVAADQRAVQAAPVALSPVPDPQPLQRPVTVPRNETERARVTVEKSKAAVAELFVAARLGRALDVAAVTPIVDEIAASILRDQSALLNVVRLKSRDEYTYLHSVAVCALMINLGRQLGLDEAEVHGVGLAGLLHDIGKTVVPEAVLAKPGPLDADELAVVRTHPERGHALLAACDGMNPIALDVCLHHHEKMDGTGYPFGRRGDALSLHARMGAICDVYDAITSERPYKAAWSANEALAQMQAWDGHFDPELLQLFVQALGIPPRDALVRLLSNRLGLVLDDGGEPTAPMVRMFYDVADDRLLPAIDVATGIGGDPIMREERWPHFFGDRWREVRATVGRGDPIGHHVRHFNCSDIPASGGAR